MDKLLAPHTPEATAHNHLTYVNSPSKPSFFAPTSPFFVEATSRVMSLRVLVYPSSENSFTWHTDQSSVDESLIAGCASYRAFDRYLSGNDIFLLPRTRSELESILRRYAYDAIHNAIASSRSPLQTGGYSRVCHLAEKSIRDVLHTGDNVDILLALHRPASTDASSHEPEDCNTRPITTKLK